ncbi:reverse transcriptase [Phytophthora megakarya]|uniref:Reverse transcriptase n=1 Tax=Phytophthora megakarya TaxID=4795 RepID=A0A225W1A1_9STRA|nr:reverse transcriptase [Phytophthora megakarya]
MWSPSTDRRAGVGILFHPQSRLTHPTAVFAEFWSPHFMAVKCSLEEDPVLLINIYAPTNRADREALFLSLASLDLPPDTKVFVGGDFNCTLYGDIDRSFHPTIPMHNSPGLRRLLQAWQLSDSLINRLPNSSEEHEKRKFYDDHHTFSYVVGETTTATCRLDRWYVNDIGRTWTKDTEVTDASVPMADHRGVLLHLQSPDNPCKVWKQPRVFPPPSYAADRVHNYVVETLEALSNRIDAEHPSAAVAAAWWDTMKTQVVVGILRETRQERRSLTNTYKQKLARLEQRKERAQYIARSFPSDSHECHAAQLKVDRIAKIIAECKRSRAQSRRQQTFRSHSWYNGKTSRDFFKRISCKFSDNTIPTLHPSDGFPPRGCHAGKACGPDRLGNDWYQAFADVLIPLLTKLYKLWYSAGIFPKSFLQANIFSLKKKGDSSIPLNYRPLSLLNTDYKILTRLLATKVTAQRMASCDPELRDAIAVLLDFSKAYDSLDREFLYSTLARHGYPAHFVNIVRALHTGTSVTFLANGQSSRSIPVHRGIRQGCPLAPLLFILALEPLYQKLDTSPRLRGIRLRSKHHARELKVAGYADDTAAYLRSASHLPDLLLLTDGFGEASGLRVNASKTCIIALHPDGPSAPMEITSPLVIQAADQSSRYLGIQVGSSASAADKTWIIAETRIRTRIRLASHRTLTVEQRSLVAASIIIPTLLYIGRHVWPRTDQVEYFNRCIRNFVWYGFFEAKIEGRRAWLSAEIASLPRVEGGLGIPDLRSELLAMAAVAVTEWASTGCTDQHLIGDILFPLHPTTTAPSVYVTPGYDPKPISGFGPHSSLLRTGVTMIRQAGEKPCSPQYVDSIEPVISLVEQCVPLEPQWEFSVFTLDCRMLAGQSWHHHCRDLLTRHGHLDHRWLPRADLKYIAQLPGATAAAALAFAQI